MQSCKTYLGTFAKSVVQISDEQCEICVFNGNVAKDLVFIGCDTVLLGDVSMVWCSVSQLPGHGPVPGSGINYSGPREILLELITNLNVILYLSTCHTVHMCTNTLYDYTILYSMVQSPS